MQHSAPVQQRPCAGSVRAARPRGRVRGRRGFTLVEVMLASFVLLFGIVSSVAVLVRGFRTIESARYTDLATQLLQSGMEDLRLLNWAQLTALQATANGVTGNVALDESFSSYNQFSAGTLSRFTLTRTIRTVPRSLRSGVSESDMRELILTASWQPAHGPRRSLTTSTYYSRGGLNDYFTTAR